MTDSVIVHVEDTPIFAEGFAGFLGEAGFSVQPDNSFRTLREALDGIDWQNTSPLIVDLKIPSEPDAAPDYQCGLDLVAAAFHHNRDIRLVVVSTELYPHHVFQLMHLGASACLKDDLPSPEELGRMLRTIQNGNLYYSRGIQPLIRAACRSVARFEPDEIDEKILERVELGQTNAQIQAEVPMGEDAVKGRLKRMFKCTGIHDRNGLAEWYFRYVRPLRGR